MWYPSGVQQQFQAPDYRVAMQVAADQCKPGQAVVYALDKHIVYLVNISHGGRLIQNGKRVTFQTKEQPAYGQPMYGHGQQGGYGQQGQQGGGMGAGTGLALGLGGGLLGERIPRLALLCT